MTSRPFSVWRPCPYIMIDPLCFVGYAFDICVFHCLLLVDTSTVFGLVRCNATAGCVRLGIGSAMPDYA